MLGCTGEAQKSQILTLLNWYISGLCNLLKHIFEISVIFHLIISNTKKNAQNIMSFDHCKNNKTNQSQTQGSCKILFQNEV